MPEYDPPHIAALEAALSRLHAQLPALPKTEILITRLLIYAGRELAGMLDQRLRPLGLSEVEFRVLASLLSQKEPVHPGGLCSQISQSPANITRITDGLVERGLISRVSSALDRRRLVLQLTPAGETLMHSLMPTMWTAVNHMFRDFSEAEKQLWVTLLKKLNANFTPQDPAEQEGNS